MEMIYGAISGLSQNIVGFPLDTIKVLKQNNMNYKYKNPLQYYKGFSYSLYCNIINNSFSFYSLHNFNEKCNNYYVSGFLTGFCISPVVFLFDIGKIKSQVSNNYFKISLQDIRKTKGKMITVTRESIALSLYFGTYYELRSQEINILASGGIAGVINWFFTYPLDIIKTRQMTFGISLQKALLMKNLWKGLNVCLIRALLVNSIGFYSYEISKQYI